MFLLYSSGDDSAEDKMQPRKPETESKSWAQPKRRFTDTSSTYSVTRAVFILTAVCLNWGSNMSTYLHRCIKITPCPFWDLEQRFIFTCHQSFIFVWQEDSPPSSSKHNTIKASTKLFLFHRLMSKKQKKSPCKEQHENCSDHTASDQDSPLSQKVFLNILISLVTHKHHTGCCLKWNMNVMTQHLTKQCRDTGTK